MMHLSNHVFQLFLWYGQSDNIPELQPEESSDNLSNKH